MKNLIVVLFLSAFVPSANAYTLSEIAGQYWTTTKQEPGLMTLIILKSNGEINIKQNAPVGGSIVCKGQSKLENNLLRSIVKCEDPTVNYRQQIDFALVRNLKKFQAPVSSDLFGMTLLMDFMKIENE